MPTDQILATEEMVGAGHATKSDTLNRALNKLTTAGDLMYATAAQTVARLAIGAANAKLFTNAGATAPEWAVGLALKTFTRDMTAANGNVAYTGIGFLPNKLILLSEISSSISIGLADASTNYVIGLHGTTPTYFGNATACISLLVDATNYQAAAVASLDADGFTLTWAKTNSPTGTGTVWCLAIR